jgi:hypothetical protein
MDNLQILFPEKLVETSAGILAITPIKMKNWDEFVKLCSRWLAFLNANSPSAFNAILSGIFIPETNDDSQYITSLQKAFDLAGKQMFEDALVLFELCLKKCPPREKIEEFSHAEFFGLLTAILAANTDFFGSLGTKKMLQAAPPAAESPSSA